TKVARHSYNHVGQTPVNLLPKGIGPCVRIDQHKVRHPRRRQPHQFHRDHSAHRDARQSEFISSNIKDTPAAHPPPPPPPASFVLLFLPTTPQLKSLPSAEIVRLHMPASLQSPG